MPRISVIICTRNRSSKIIPCLDAISQSLTHAMPIDAEIVIINNASTDDTEAVINKWANSCPYPLHIFYEAQPGISYARNSGIKYSKGDLLAWTDDDCIMDIEFISKAVAYDDADGDQLVLRGGRVNLGDQTDLPLTIKPLPNKNRMLKQENSARLMPVTDIFYGCNMTMRRTLTDKVGWFDTMISPANKIFAGEDADYGMRAYLGGILIEYVPDMIVTHFHGRKTPQEGYKLFCGYSIANGALFAKYLFKDYNLCRQVYWDFKNMLKELITGRNLFMAEINFSYKTKFIYHMLGIYRFIISK